MKKIQAILIALSVFSLLQCTPSSSENKITPPMSSTVPDSSKTTFTSGHADVNGISMYYEIYGIGKPLVLIHGGGSTIQTSFQNVIPLLSKSRKVVAIELQAHGRTTDRDTPISFEQDADDVAALLQYLKIEKCDVLGFSNGGNTTMQLAVRHPGLVNRIIIASSFFRRDGMMPGFWDFMKKGTFADMPASLKEAFLNVTPDSARLHNLYTKCSQRMLTFEDWDESVLKSIKATSLIVMSDKDVATPEHATKMYRLIPASHLIILPGSHGEYMGEASFPNGPQNAAAFVPLIEQFLDQN